MLGTPRIRRPVALGGTLLLALSALLAPSNGALAGPQDTRVGETRVVYDKKGTILKAEPSATAAAAATLPANTSVVVEEVRLPWVKVRAATGTGWLRAYQAIETTALAAAPPPAHIEGTAEGGVSARDASAAGRQLTAKTESSFRTSRADLENAYRWVDTIERETASIDPLDSIAFLMDGDLGRRGRDYNLPPRLPKEEIDSDDDTEPAGGTAPEAEEEDDDGGVPGKVIDGLGGLLGGKGKKLRKVAKFVKAASPFVKAMSSYSDRLEKEFTPTQEYYLGRAVAANAIAQHGIDPDTARRAYVRRVGDAIVRVSGRLPPTVGGYHFDVLATDEVNAVAGPGGWILVTRGAVTACATEDELAGVLCHELAHVALRHGEQVVRKSSEFQGQMRAGTALLRRVVKKTDGAMGQGLLQVFRGAVDGMHRTAIGHRYGRQLEFAADVEGANILWDVYYDWTALTRYLYRLKDDHDAQDAEHAAPGVRARNLFEFTRQLGPVDLSPATLGFRQARIETSLGRPRTAPVTGPTPPAPPAPAPVPRSPSSSSGGGTPLPPPPPPPTPLPTPR